MRKSIERFPLIPLALFAFSACQSSERWPAIEAPVEAVEKSLSETDPSLIDQEGENIPYRWWEIFEDDQLASYIEQALQKNPTFQTSQAKVYYASSVASQARSTLFPTLSYGADVLREKFSQTGLIPFSLGSAPTNPAVPKGAGPSIAAQGGTNQIPVYFTQYETELSLMYEFDFWKKNRNTLKAAVGEIKAAVADEIFARLTLSVAIAQTYYQLQIDYERHRILQELVKVREESLKLTEQRLNANLNDALSVKLSQTNYSQAVQKMLDVELDIALKKHQLGAYLASNFEEEFEDLKLTPKNLPRVPIPKNLPLHLLARRPDITSQLWLIESADKRIDVAKAGFYPDFNITGFYGLQTIHLSKLFQWPSTFFAVDPAVTLPIFDGGRLQSLLTQSEVNYDQAILKYNDLVINAVKEVLDGLASLQNSDKQLKIFEKITEDQRELLKLTSIRVKNNIDSRLDELVRKDNLLEAEDQETMILGNRIDAILTLIKSLGGGYDSCDSEDVQ